jgi:hypothetical protein
MNKGIICQIYRWNLGECSNGGISSKFNEVVVIDPYINGPFEPNENTPAVKLVRRTIGGESYIHAEPILPNGEWKHFMAGGTFISSCDSRFRSVCKYPVALHDRTEG